MSCSSPPRLHFSFSNVSIWPAWPDIPSPVASPYSSRTSILTFFQKACFSGTSFFIFFLRIACQNDPKMWPYRHIWSSKMMPCRLFVVFSRTLFLNDPMVIWTHFRMSADQVSGKKPARTHSKPLWRHILAKQLSKTHTGAKLTKNRYQLRSKWTTWPPTQLRYLSLGAPLCDTWAPNLKKQSPGIQILRKVR